MQGQVGVDQVPRVGAQSLLANELPQLAQVDHVGAQGVGRRILGGGAHDESGGFVGLDNGLNTAVRKALALASSSILADTPTPRPCGMYTR